VWVEGIKQTSEHYDELWADAFVHANMLKDRAVTEVLMLGLAGGGALKAIYEAYPGCHITAVEIDPVMVEIAQELQLQKPQRPKSKTKAGQTSGRALARIYSDIF